MQLSLLGSDPSISRMGSHRSPYRTTSTSLNQMSESITDMSSGTYYRLKCFVQFHTSLLTQQNDLAVFDYSTRETCTNTCNENRVGRPE